MLFDSEYNDILFDYANSKSDLLQSIEEYKYYMEHGNITCDITHNEEYKNLQFQMISEQYKKGLISFEDIRKKIIIYELFSMYYFNCFIRGPILDIEKIDQYYNSNLLVNSSFNEFYQK